MPLLLDEVCNAYIRDHAETAVKALWTEMASQPGTMFAWSQSEATALAGPVHVAMPMMSEYYALVCQHHPAGDTAEAMCDVIDRVFSKALRARGIQATCMGDGDSVWFKLAG